MIGYLREENRGGRQTAMTAWFGQPRSFMPVREYVLKQHGRGYPDQKGPIGP